MKLTPRKWYVRWFFWSFQILLAFRYEHDYRQDSEMDRVKQGGTNLCHFVRTTMLWTPLLLVEHLVLYASAIAVLTTIPAHLFGWGYAWFWFWVTVVVAVIFGVVMLARLILKIIDDWDDSRQAKKVGRAKQKAPSEPSFLAILWAYAVSVKQKVCPLITFSDEKETA